jgi:hypothetical protein
MSTDYEKIQQQALERARESFGPLYDLMVENNVPYGFVEWHGSGDEGWVGDDGMLGRLHPDESSPGLVVPEEVSELAVGLVEQVVEGCWAGWENNEGGVGHAIIHAHERRVEFHMGYYVENVEWQPPVTVGP